MPENLHILKFTSISILFIKTYRPGNKNKYCPAFSATILCTILASFRPKISLYSEYSEALYKIFMILFIKMHLSFNLWYRSIRCLRNIIHWNLITTFILRNVMWFLLQLIDHNIHESNEVQCWFTVLCAAYSYKSSRNS